MKPSLAAIFLLPLALAETERPAWLDAAQKSGCGVLASMDEGCRSVDAEIASLGDDYLAPLDEPLDDRLPEAEDGFAVVVSDGGLLFDSDHARVTYIGNVRVNEQRLQLRCRNRLYIQLPPTTVQDGKDEAKRASRPKAGTPANKTAPQPATRPASAPVPAAQKPAAPATTAPVKAEPLPAEVPMEVSSYDVMVNGLTNDILLRSHGREHQPRIRRAGSEIVLQAREDGQDSYVLADRSGDIHVRSGRLSVHWVDAQGGRGTLVADKGCLEFNRENNSIYIEGPSHLVMPDGEMVDCEQSLCLSLIPAEGMPEVADRSGFLSQFTSLDYQGIERAVALGNVRVRRPQLDTQESASAQGDRFEYDGRNGKCRLSGGDCRLIYGGHELHTSDCITLDPNGDITVHGDKVDGYYVLPTAAGEEAERGKYVTNSYIHFRAETGVVEMPGGIQAQDSINKISCTGPVKLQMKRTAPLPPVDRKTGMLNLAARAYTEVSVLDAMGQVYVHYEDGRTGQNVDLRGGHVICNLEKGTAYVSALENEAVKIVFNGHALTAVSVGRDSFMQLDEQGNMDVKGESIHARFLLEDDVAMLNCTSYLHLNRESRELELGPAGDMRSSTAFMTSNGPLHLVLEEGRRPAMAASPRYPHLCYNYEGIESALTERGGTLRTEKASMQCTGLIDMKMAPIPAGATQEPDALSRLHAVVEGNVSVLSKDATGRLIRATGDRMEVDGATGRKVLTGAQVSLADERNTHIASGKGASIVVDAANNARVSGAKHTTVATRLQEQSDSQNGKTSKNSQKKR